MSAKRYNVWPIAAVAICVVLSAVRAEAAPVTAAQAGRVFAEADALCKADAGKLWGVSLCVPMMVVDPRTREAFTNRATPDATPDGLLFRLTLPKNAQISTAPFTYGGVNWAQLTLPLFGDARTQAVTLMHESFHIVQPRLGYYGNVDNGSIAGDAQLDTQIGRIWLRGELHALRTALQSNGAPRKRALADAIAMRLYRDKELPGTAQTERTLDLLEGLAESTGIDVALPPPQRIPQAIFDMTFVESQPSYARAFPYATGPAYTELLDAADLQWRRAVTPSSDISNMTMRAYGLNVQTPTAAQAHAIIIRYGGAAIEAQEAARARRRAALAKTYTSELVKGATVQLPMIQFHITFNPRDIETLAPYGSVYHTLRITARWGALTVSGGDALIPKNFHFVRLAAPADTQGSIVRGRAWKLELASGYVMVADPKRPGSFTVSGPR